MLKRSIAVAACLLWAAAILTAQRGAQNGEWPHWSGDLGNTKYSPLDQINAGNVKDLRIVWRWKTDNMGPRVDANLESTPLMIGGVLYTTAGLRRNVVAIDGATGETLWMYRLDEGQRGVIAPRRNSGRGVEYWTDGRIARIILITQGFRMVSLDAKTGLPDPAFGKGGVVDLYEDFDQPTPSDGTIGSTSPAVVVKDVIVMGNALLSGGSPRSKANTKGYIRGFDIRTGKRLWTFHTIPRPGEVGNETWLNDSWAYTGNTGAWAPLSADEELGYVYLPIEMPTGDYYGGERPGNNLFADSLVCLDARTGKRVWHFQMVHHDVWDRDLASPPSLIDITVNGRPIRAVAVASKQSFLYVFDRTNGQPVWPIEERPVPKGDVPGEWYSPTQPFPTRPAPFDRQGMTDADLIDFTPELKAEAREMVKPYKLGELFTPPMVANTNGVRAVLNAPGAQGSALWQGSSWDPETNMLYVPSISTIFTQSLQPGGDRSDMRYVGGGGGGADPDAAPAGRGATPAAPAAAGGGRGRGALTPLGPGATRGPWGMGPQGLPLVKPPYGRITAYNMNTGDIVWQVANGDTYEWVTTHPALKGIEIPKTGRADEGGVLVTKTLLFAGQGCGLFRSGGGGGPKFYAYDKATGNVVHEMTLPAFTCGNPMTYTVGGKQYIAVAIGAPSFSPELIALSLP